MTVGDEFTEKSPFSGDDGGGKELFSNCAIAVDCVGAGTPDCHSPRRQRPHNATSVSK
jgi:hypothetical protein